MQLFKLINNRDNHTTNTEGLSYHESNTAGKRATVKFKLVSIISVFLQQYAARTLQLFENNTSNVDR